MPVPGLNILYQEWLINWANEHERKTNGRYFEPHTFVNAQAWLRFLQGMLRVSPTVTTMKIIIGIANNEIGYLEQMRAKVLYAHEKEMKNWDASFASLRSDFEAYLPWLEQDPTPIAASATTAAIIHGFDGKPSLMQRIVGLYNQITPVVDLGEEYSGAGAFVINTYRAVDTQLSKSAPGEDKTLRDYVDSSLQGLRNFFGNLPKTAGNLATIAALGFGAIAAIYLLKK